jgi:hypothetical protein
MLSSDREGTAPNSNINATRGVLSSNNSVGSHGTHIATWLCIQTPTSERVVFSLITLRGYVMPMKWRCNFQRNSNTQGARDFCSIPDVHICRADFDEDFIFDMGCWEIRLQKLWIIRFPVTEVNTATWDLNSWGRQCKSGSKSRNDTKWSSSNWNTNRKQTVNITDLSKQRLLIFLLLWSSNDTFQYCDSKRRMVRWETNLEGSVPAHIDVLSWHLQVGPEWNHKKSLLVQWKTALICWFTCAR